MDKKWKILWQKEKLHVLHNMRNHNLFFNKHVRMRLQVGKDLVLLPCKCGWLITQVILQNYFGVSQPLQVEEVGLSKRNRKVSVYLVQTSKLFEQKCTFEPKECFIPRLYHPGYR